MVVAHCHCVGWVATLTLVVGSLLFSHSGGGGCSLVLVAVVGWQEWWVAIACGCQSDEDDKR